MAGATRLRRLVSSPVRDLLAMTERSDVVSFAGGLPAPDSFPDVSSLPIPGSALQYGASEGDWMLRCRIAQMITERGLACEPVQVLILSGSQQGIDLVAKFAVEEGTRIAVESPTYLAALQVFSLFGADYQCFEVGRTPPRAELVYVNPTFQNPTGLCYTPEQRAAVRSAAALHGALLFEDDPYHDLWFEGVDRTPLVAGYAGSWVYQGSFSKSLAPGLRLGYLVASADVIGTLVQLKQAADLHSNRVSQHWVWSLLAAPDRAERLSALRARYRERRDYFAAMLEHQLGALARWSVPSGGLFFWLQLKHGGIDTRALLDRCLAEGVAFMPGKFFYADRGHPDAEASVRMNFSNASERDAAVGLAKVAAAIRRMIDNQKGLVP